MDLLAEKRTFRLSWIGRGAVGAVRTSRHSGQRERWGLGLVRLAADALGGSVLPLSTLGDGTSQAVISLQTGASRLTLPLAAISDGGTVQRATRAWDEETGVLPGSEVTGPLSELVERARERRGVVVTGAPYVARRGARVTWIAQEPRGTREFAGDLVAGLAHERALAGDDEGSLRLLGCAAALALALGAPTEMWYRTALDDQLPRTCAAFGVRVPLIQGGGTEGPPAPLVAFLVREGGGGRVEDENGRWQFRPQSLESPFIEHLAVAGVVPLA